MITELDILKFCGNPQYHVIHMFDILLTAKAGGFCYQQHLPRKLGLTVSPAWVDAPTRIFSLSVLR